MRAKRCDAENIKRRLKEAKKQQTLANRRKQEAEVHNMSVRLRC